MNSQSPIHADDVCVVVPIYREEPTWFEAVSLQRCMDMLGHHPIYFIYPEGTSLEGYRKWMDGVTRRQFPCEYFESVERYSQMALSTWFYESFSDHRWILIYQTDSFVFSRNLCLWAERGYDYIGAPWVHVDVRTWMSHARYPLRLRMLHGMLGRGRMLKRVGNGGFSLRNIRATLRVLDRYSTPAKRWRSNEDLFFAHYVGTFDRRFRIAPMEAAYRFSFDTFPDKLWNMAGKQLPFGCHGWCRSDLPIYEHAYSFWKPRIEACGFNLP